MKMLSQMIQHFASPMQELEFKRFYEPIMCDRSRLRWAVSETLGDVNSDVQAQMSRYEQRKSEVAFISKASTLMLQCSLYSQQAQMRRVSEDCAAKAEPQV